MFDFIKYNTQLDDFLNSIPFIDCEQKKSFKKFITNINPQNTYYLLKLKNDFYYKVIIKKLKNKKSLICFNDVSEINKLTKQLEVKNSKLNDTNIQLEILAQNTRELAITKTKTNIAQNVHDILGHSLTVVIGTCELAVIESDKNIISQKLSQITELLINSLSDLKNSISGKEFELEQTSLIKAINSLKNLSINVDFVSQGVPYELNTKQTEAIFRLCQEAVTNSIKHGMAKTIHIILRFKYENLEVFAIDDGIGCNKIIMNYGLSGIKKRITELKGNVSFGSHENNGFNIHAHIPKNL